MVQIASFRPEDRNPEKGQQIWGDVEDVYHAYMAYQMCLRMVSECNRKYGTDKTGKETTFKTNFDVRVLGLCQSRLKTTDHDLPHVSLNYYSRLRNWKRQALIFPEWKMRSTL